MEEINLVGESLKFMVLGMGIVFSFLTVMIYALKLQAYLIKIFFKEEVSKSTKKKTSQSNLNNDDKIITAAITASIIHHNNIK